MFFSEFLLKKWKENRDHGAIVVCLQECSKFVFDNILEHGIWDGAHSSSFKRSDDHTAVLWDKNRFIIQEHRDPSLVFLNRLNHYEQFKCSQNQCRAVLIVPLQFKNQGIKLNVCSFHAKGGLDNPDRRGFENIVSYITSIASEHHQHFVLGADLNWVVKGGHHAEFKKLFKKSNLCALHNVDAILSNGKCGKKTEDENFFDSKLYKYYVTLSSKEEDLQQDDVEGWKKFALTDHEPVLAKVNIPATFQSAKFPIAFAQRTLSRQGLLPPFHRLRKTIRRSF